MKLLAVIAAATLAACSADEPAPDASDAPTAQVDTAALGAHSLAVNSLPEMQLLASSSGREVLSRIVSCALPRGASITAINRSGTPANRATIREPSCPVDPVTPITCPPGPSRCRCTAARPPHPPGTSPPKRPVRQRTA